jgi:hypothetical protein
MITSARLLLALLLSALALLAPGAARAQTTQWSCWLDNDDSTQAVCMVMASALDPRQSTVEPRLTRGHTLSPAEYLRVVRERPNELRGQQVYVPLHTVPTEEAPVAVLMQAVLCGALPHCQARYRHDMSRLFAHAPELFVDMNEPQWEARPI